MNERDADRFVKKETMLIVAFIAAVAGFLAGIVFSVYYSGSGQVVHTSSGPIQPGPARQPGLSAEQASSILNLEKEVAANPNNVDAWIRLGNVYFDTHNSAKAIRAYEQSLRLHPDNPDVLTDLGVMYRRNSQPEKALEAFDKAIRINPRHQQALYNKGIVLKFDMHDSEGAVKIWEEQLKINPNATLPDGTPLQQMIESLK